MLFTKHCSGDLGIVVGEHRVVALFFERSSAARSQGADMFAVMDVVRGGDAVYSGDNLDEALNAMVNIAQREEVKVNSTKET